MWRKSGTYKEEVDERWVGEGHDNVNYMGKQ